MVPQRAGLETFRQVWLCDFEYRHPPSERPYPRSMVAREFRSGRTIRMRQDELWGRKEAPFPTSSDCLFVSYYAPAELGCFLTLGWPVPRRILDLFCEFRNLTNGLPLQRARLLDALSFYRLDAVGADHKQQMQELAQVGRDLSAEEWDALLKYNESDVLALAQLLPAMLPELNLPRAVLRARYMAAVARIQANGIPVDVEALVRLR